MISTGHGVPLTVPSVQELQRERVKVETKGKATEITAAFRPQGWSLTQALCTRDLRDPNRNGHRKRSMMDSMDLLQFRQTQVRNPKP